MTLRIDRSSDGPNTTLRLTGRIKAEHLPDLEVQIQDCGQQVVVDLEEVDLVDIEVVRFLGVCEKRGVKLVNCSPYIREWIERERD